MRLYRTNNEIIIFLINFFLLQLVGRALIWLVLWIFRFFGMPQPYIWFQSIPNIRHWTFTILLIIAVAISVVRIIKKRDK